MQDNDETPGKINYELSNFFSSRSRHTRFDCDWSSDVCSSDLLRQPDPEDPIGDGHSDADHVYQLDRKSTRLNSSHSQISYAVFCLKKNKCISRGRSDSRCSLKIPEISPSRRQMWYLRSMMLFFFLI